MSGLKRREPALAFGWYDITPDEIDRYEVFSWTPAINVRWWASAGTAGTASAIALVILNRLPDYPRNISFILAGSATGMAGSLDVNGKDQFGNTISETLGFGSADNGGTVSGTKVFGQITSGTLRYGTAIGAGTPQIGFVPGTDCLLGLPVKVARVADVVHLGYTKGTGAVSYAGGSVGTGAFVNTGVHAIRPGAALDGTATVNAWVVSSFDATNMGTVANQQQI